MIMLPIKEKAEAILELTIYPMPPNIKRSIRRGFNYLTKEAGGDLFIDENPAMLKPERVKAKKDIKSEEESKE